MSIQDSTEDPYASLKKHQAGKPKQSDIVSGTVPGQLAGNPAILDRHGIKMNRSNMSGKEVQDMRAMEKARKYTVKFNAFASESDDGVVRLYFEVVTKYSNGHEYHMVPLGYTKEQLQDFISAIQTVEGEILLENIKTGESAGTPGAENVGTPGDPVQ